ncbi:MAG: 16S rRNA (cytidine(1402)-2'-O)-methyltransferase [Deltaproteobacteria bacterium]|nr:16S rRNA (cytidine(1402)-2'-O)-methyltransferase [Deltaproteobacteria bacterium]
MSKRKSSSLLYQREGIVSNESEKNGKLYVVGTPIGNLQDLTYRAKDVLKRVHTIAAENAGHVRKLLCALNVLQTRVWSYREENRVKVTPQLMDLLFEGKDVALVTDAGMPTIADPGAHLVDCALERRIPVVPIPGPSAVVTALSVSGFRAETFVFLGFLSRSKSHLQEQLGEIARSSRTVVCFEAPHRLSQTLTAMANVIPERKVALCRELTKFHEEIMRGTVQEMESFIRSRENVQGEMTLVIEGASLSAQDEEEKWERAKEWIDRAFQKGEKTIRQIVEEAAILYGVPRSKVYRYSLAKKGEWEK